MPTYTYPEMPLRMNVWYQAKDPPPLGPPDKQDVPCSLSPIKPNEYAAASVNTDHYHPFTHIIRSPVDLNLCDNYLRGDETTLWPITFFEIPSGSGKFYICLWTHQCGAGFPNHHARTFACRYNYGTLANTPWFIGYI